AVASVLFPARLPLLHGSLNALLALRRRCLALARRDVIRLENSKGRKQFSYLRFITLELNCQLLATELRLVQVRALSLAQLTRVLNRLLEARRVGAKLVV